LKKEETQKVNDEKNHFQIVKIKKDSNIEKVSLYAGFLLLKEPKNVVTLTTLGKAVSNLFDIVDYLRRRIIKLHCDFRIRVVDIDSKNPHKNYKVQKTETTVHMSLNLPE